jgi:isopentenyl-diphosphate delta-isomerase
MTKGNTVPSQATENRKKEHIEISLEKDVQSRVTNGFEDIILVHRALPEIDKDDIDLTTDFFGKKIYAPIIIAGMTGGHRKAIKINKNLALAAQELNIPMGVGSQRAAIEDESLSNTYSIAREVAPDIFLIANLGAVQFSEGYGVEEARAAIKMIDANALAIHLNPLQEVIMSEGDINFKGCIEKLKDLKKLDVPLIAKETGAGIAREEAKKLEEIGFSALDVSGVGGTSFSAVEYYRRKSSLGKTFWNWGIPTAISTIECVESTNLKIISTGGIRDGIQIAKALALGASACGIALPLLHRAEKSAEEVVREISRMISELKTAMFLVGANSIDDLRKCDVIITGKTREWIEARGIDYKKFANRRR